MVKYNLAIVGATGAVGQEMVRLLEQRQFPIKKIRCFASARSEGKEIIFAGEKISIEILKENCFNDIDLALFSAGKKVSFEFGPKAALQGAWVIDNSSAFRMDPKTPLIVPEINRHALPRKCGIIASPNCVAAIIVMALAPLHRAFGIERIVASTYQAASGAGATAMAELKEETLCFLEKKPFQRTIMPHPYAFNLFPHNAPMTSNGYNEEEIKVVEEIRKILETPHLPIAVTCIRVPIFRAHSIALNVAFGEKITPEAARALLLHAPGITLLEDWDANRFPMPTDATGNDAIFVGRIRKDLSHPNALDLWVVGDQLLKGAALNAIQIAEEVCNFKKIS